jgi:predicted CopG family antitoxin
MKTITITGEAFAKLKSMKKNNESFSKFFERLASKATPVEILEKIRESMELKEKDKIIKEIYSKRAETR